MVLVQISVQKSRVMNYKLTNLRKCHNISLSTRGPLVFEVGYNPRKKFT